MGLTEDTGMTPSPVTKPRQAGTHTPSCWMRNLGLVWRSHTRARRARDDLCSAPPPHSSAPGCRAAEMISHQAP